MISHLFCFFQFLFLLVRATDVLPVDIWADISERLELIDKIVLGHSSSTARFAIRETVATYKDLIKECGSEALRLIFPSFALFYSNFPMFIKLLLGSYNKRCFYCLMTLYCAKAQRSDEWT